MLDQLPHFLWLGLIATTLDVDNAFYMKSATQGRSEEEQKRLIFWHRHATKLQPKERAE